MKEYMLTTVDNPYNPHTQFDEWYAFDEQHGYCTCELLARIAKVSDEFNIYDENLENEQNSEIQQAIDDIIKLNPLGLYTRIYKDGTIGEGSV